MAKHVPFELTVLNEERGQEAVAIEIDEASVPQREVWNDASETWSQEPDYGNADWPSDRQVSKAATKALRRKVKLKFFDVGGSLTEGLYHAVERARP